MSNLKQKTSIYINKNDNKLVQIVIKLKKSLILDKLFKMF